MSLVGQVRNRLRALGAARFKRSYSQCGEDMIVEFLCREILGLESVTYADVGAHHASHLSNTYYFYQTGGRGVCVEPDPALAAEIRRVRPRDIVLNVGIGDGVGRAADLHLFGDRGFNTMSSEMAEKVAGIAGMASTGSIRVPLIAVGELFDQHLKAVPNFVSLDTEGMDLTILRSIDFARYRPEVFCVETLTADTWERTPEVTRFFEANDYEVYADTNVNTIYVDSAAMARARARHGR